MGEKAGRVGIGAFWLLLASAAAAEQNFNLPASSVGEYRINSQYGPDVAVMNPLFPKDSKLELGAGFGYSPVSSLMSYRSAMGSLVYHINRRHAIEPLWLSYSWAKESDFVQTQIAARKPGETSTLQVELPQMLMAASYLFSPYYAKMQITPRTVAHFDVYMGAGFGLVRGVEHYLDNHEGAKMMRAGASLSVGTRLLMEPRWGLRLEMRDFIYKQQNFGVQSFVNTLQLTASVSVFFGRFPDYRN